MKRPSFQVGQIRGREEPPFPYGLFKSEQGLPPFPYDPIPLYLEAPLVVLALLRALP